MLLAVSSSSCLWVACFSLACEHVLHCWVCTGWGWITFDRWVNMDISDRVGVITSVVVSVGAPTTVAGLEVCIGAGDSHVAVLVSGNDVTMVAEIAAPQCSQSLLAHPALPQGTDCFLPKICASSAERAVLALELSSLNCSPRFAGMLSVVLRLCSSLLPCTLLSTLGLQEVHLCTEAILGSAKTCSPLATISPWPSCTWPWDAITCWLVWLVLVEREVRQPVTWSAGLLARSEHSVFVLVLQYWQSIGPEEWLQMELAAACMHELLVVAVVDLFCSIIALVHWGWAAHVLLTSEPSTASISKRKADFDWGSWCIALALVTELSAGTWLPSCKLLIWLSATTSLTCAVTEISASLFTLLCFGGAVAGSLASTETGAAGVKLSVVEDDVPATESATKSCLISPDWIHAS